MATGHAGDKSDVTLVSFGMSSGTSVAHRAIQPRISVITVTFNSASLLRNAMDSVLAQDDGSLEYLVIDGASTDGTVAIAESYRDRLGDRLRVVSEPDAGLYYAMNKGIGLAAGEIICLLNSDDRLLPGALALVRAVMTETDADVAFGDVVVEGGFGARTLHASLDGLESAMTVPHPGCFVRARAYRRWGVFDTRLRIAADYDLLLRLRRGGATFVPLRAAVASFADGGASSRSFALAREMFVIHRRQLSLRHAVRHVAVRLAMGAYLHARRALGMRLLGEARYAKLRARLRRTDLPRLP